MTPTIHALLLADDIEAATEAAGGPTRALYAVLDEIEALLEQEARACREAGTIGIGGHWSTDGDPDAWHPWTLHRDANLRTSETLATLFFYTTGAVEAHMEPDGPRHRAASVREAMKWAVRAAKLRGVLL